MTRLNEFPRHVKELGAPWKERICPLCQKQAFTKVYQASKKLWAYKHSTRRYGITQTTYCYAKF